MDDLVLSGAQQFVHFLSSVRYDNSVLGLNMQGKFISLDMHTWSVTGSCRSLEHRALKGSFFLRPIGPQVCPNVYL